MRNILVNWIWLLLFCALAFGFIIGGWSASKDISPQQHAEQASAAQGRTEPRSANVSESRAEQEQTKAGDKKEPHGGTVFGWISNFFEVKLTDLLIAIFTVVLAVKTSGLFRETAGLRELASEQSRDMKASINAAEKAADAATLSAKAAIGMELPVIRVERFPGLINVPERPSPDKPFRPGLYTSNVPQQFSVLSSLEFRNVGRTPAFPIKLMMGWKVGSELPAEPDYFNSVNSSSAAIIKPDREFDAAARIVVELSPDDRDMLLKGTAFIWLYASLHYRDFLNNPHEARFCWRSTTGIFGFEGSFPASYTTHS